MRSRRDAEAARDEIEDDEEDHLPVPASPLRVVIGLIMFVSGILIAMRWNETWFIWVGVAVWLLSYPVMLKRPDRK